jgi:hypothetical protein
MYILALHTITDPAAFWKAADPNNLPPQAKLHHTFPTPDGTKAVCIWEADSPDTVRNLLEPMIGRISRNEYFPVENKEGVARPSRVAQPAAAGR